MKRKLLTLVLALSMVVAYAMPVFNHGTESYAATSKTVEEAMNRLKPEWLTDEKKHEWDTRGVWSDKLTGEEKDGINDYLKSVDLCLKDDFEKQTDISFDHLTDEEFEHLADSNDFTAGQLMELQGWIA